MAWSPAARLYGDRLTPAPAAPFCDRASRNLLARFFRAGGYWSQWDVRDVEKTEAWASRVAERHPGDPKRDGEASKAVPLVVGDVPLPVDYGPTGRLTSAPVRLQAYRAGPPGW